MGNISQREYKARIHRAQDFIEKNLDQPLALEDIAGAAHFSPFHFHRVYHAMTGETIYQFILRIRLERAASNLCQRPAEPVTNIALDLGFSSPATFARAFKAKFGLSASEYRRHHLRKNCKAQGKASKALQDGGPYSAKVDVDINPRRKTMNSVKPRSIEIKELAARQVAYVRHVGPYAGDEALFGRLFSTATNWADARGLLSRPGMECVAIYHDDPEVTAPDKLRLSVGVTVPAGTPAAGEVNLLELPGGRYLCALFEIGASEFGAAWQYVCGEYLPQSGWQPGDGPCYESYLNDCREHPQGKHLVEIRLSVKPL
ncbi:MAG: AraC family transcriptional regulator [Propionivibrio sp.]